MLSDVVFAWNFTHYARRSVRFYQFSRRVFDEAEYSFPVLCWICPQRNNLSKYAGIDSNDVTLHPSTFSFCASQDELSTPVFESYPVEFNLFTLDEFITYSKLNYFVFSNLLCRTLRELVIQHIWTYFFPVRIIHFVREIYPWIMGGEEECPRATQA